MTIETSAELVTEMRGPVLWTTINREDKRNALNQAVLAGLSETLASANRKRWPYRVRKNRGIM